MYAALLLIVCFNNVLSLSNGPKVAVVTGANKGIGYEIVKGLLENYNGHVYLTSRDESRGKKAVEDLKKLGLNPYYHQLDVTDLTSIRKFRDHIAKTEGGIDILINNAGYGYFGDSPPSFKEVENTMKVNYFGVRDVSAALFPLIRNNGRVVNLGSTLGLLSKIPSEKLRSKLGSQTLSINELSGLMTDYTKLAKQKRHGNEGWPTNDISSYTVSKAGVAALTFIQQREFDAEVAKRNIIVNCAHPGYVDTDLTHHAGILTPKQGARSSLYLALENHQLRGKFLADDLKVVDWHKAP